MKDKIVKIIIFAVAILDCVIALLFAFKFNEDKKDAFFQARKVQEQCPALVTDLQAATPESLPAIVETYQKNMRSFSDSLNGVQMQKDILYTYLQDLKGLDDKSFEQYKAGFPQRSASLFAKCDKKQEYVDGFNAVNTFKDLEGYTKNIEKEYNALKQSYLVGREYSKAANSLIGRADMINATASANKKTADLQDLQNDLKEFKSNANLENAFIIIGYLTGAIAILLMLWFALERIVKDFKSSYKILLVLVAFTLIVFIGYLVGSPVLSPSAIKFGMSSTGYKMVNAACFTVYCVLLCAILAILASLIVNFVKNRK